MHCFPSITRIVLQSCVFFVVAHLLATIIVFKVLCAHLNRLSKFEPQDSFLPSKLQRNWTSVLHDRDFIILDKAQNA